MDTARTSRDSSVHVTDVRVNTISHLSVTTLTLWVATAAALPPPRWVPIAGYEEAPLVEGLAAVIQRWAGCSARPGKEKAIHAERATRWLS